MYQLQNSDVNHTSYLCDVKYCRILYLRLAFVRDIYLCFDRIFSGFIGMLPNRPMIIPIKVRLDVQRTLAGIIQNGSATTGIRAGKYTPDGTTNFRKVLNKRCALQSVYKNYARLVKDCVQNVKPQGDVIWVLPGGHQLYRLCVFCRYTNHSLIG